MKDMKTDPIRAKFSLQAFMSLLSKNVFFAPH